MKSKVVLALALGFFQSVGWAGDSDVIGVIQGNGVKFGTGYNSEREKFVGVCVEGETEMDGAQEATLNLWQKISQQELESSLGVSAGGRAQIGVVSFGASADFYKKSVSSGYSFTTIFRSEYQFKNRIFSKTQLSEIGKKVVGDDERWRVTCGNRYVYREVLGARLYFLIRVDFKSEESRQRFQASFDVSGPTWGANGKFEKALKAFSKESEVTVSALQIGGKVDKISNIFQGKSESIHSDDKKSGVESFLKCSFGEITDCLKVLENAVEYGTNTQTGFPSQIDPETEVGKSGGPAVLEYHTQEYTALGIYPNFSSELNQAIRLARSGMGQIFTNTLSLYLRADRTLESKLIRLSAAQRVRFEALKRLLWQNLQVIVGSSQDCYEIPGNCVVNYKTLLLDESAGGLKKVSPEELEVLPETFAQYCDIAFSSENEKELRKTIEAMNDVAKKSDATAFEPKYEGETVDVCGIAQKVLLGIGSLELRELGLTDLRPIGTLPYLLSLDLTGNKISDLRPLARLRSIQTLILAKNKIEDLSPLEGLQTLVNLHLADNLISDAKGVSSLGRVALLDLRNNGPSVQCPFADPLRCLILDFRNTSSFVALHRGIKIPRVGSDSVDLGNGTVLITGGYFNSKDNSAEIFDDATGEFRLIAGMNAARSMHRVSKIPGGGVLVSGGWNGMRSIELYDPVSERFEKSASVMSSGRVSHTSTVLKDGRILLAGGWSGRYGHFVGDDQVSSADVFDSRTQNVISVGSMKLPRAEHTATVLPSGDVLILGGYSPNQSLNTAEIFSASDSKFNLQKSRMKHGRGLHTATLLHDGTVLIVGGFTESNHALASAELYDSRTGRFESIQAALSQPRAGHAAVLLSDGRVLIAGGSSARVVFNGLGEMPECVQCSQTAEIYDPATRTFTEVSHPLNDKRGVFGAIPLDADRVLFLGGFGSGVSPFSAEMFEYTPGPSRK